MGVFTANEEKISASGCKVSLHTALGLKKLEDEKHLFSLGKLVNKLDLVKDQKEVLYVINFNYKRLTFTLIGKTLEDLENLLKSDTTNIKKFFGLSSKDEYLNPREFKSAEDYANYVLRRMDDLTNSIGADNYIADGFKVVKTLVAIPENVERANINNLLSAKDARSFQDADGFADIRKAFKDSNGNIYAYLKDNAKIESLSKKTLWYFHKLNNFEQNHLKLKNFYLTNDNGKTWVQTTPIDFRKAYEGKSRAQLISEWNEANR